MTITRAAITVAGLVLVASCGGATSVDTAAVEADVKATVDGPGSVEVEAVDCPDDETAEVGKTFTCPYELTDGSSGEITITVRTEDGAGSWAVTRPASGQAEEQIRTDYEEQFDDQVEAVECPDPLDSAEKPAAICDIELVSGAKRTAEVTVTEGGKIRWKTE